MKVSLFESNGHAHGSFQIGRVMFSSAGSLPQTCCHPETSDGLLISDLMDDATWCALLETCARRAGDPLSEPPESWELCLLAKVASKRFGVAVRKLESQLLEAKSLAHGREILEEILPKTSHIEEILTTLPRSRSPRRRHLLNAKEALKQIPRSSVEFGRLTEKLLLAGKATANEAGAELPRRFRSLRAPVSLGPPAFFPVGNAAGRFSEPLTLGLEVAEPDLLFVGISDPRHLFTSLEALDSLKTSKVRCVLNDLNAETCARNALILELLEGRSLDLAQRILTIFALWWLHELPLKALPLLCQAAKRAQGHSCSKTEEVLKKWIQTWDAPHSYNGSELQQIVSKADLAKSNLEVAKSFTLDEAVVSNITLRHDAARLYYNLHSGFCVPDGWEEAGDGVLLWPNLDESEEFDPDEGTPSEADYLAALAKLLPRFMSTLSSLAEWSFKVKWRCVAGDCLSVELPGPFHRIFTSNVADHVGVVNLVLALVPLLHEDGKMQICLSNNLKALDFNGDIFSLFPKLYNLTVETLGHHFGLHSSPGSRDQLWIQRAQPSQLIDDQKTQKTWLLDVARRLYRCPAADEETLKRRMDYGDVLGMAHRFLRRFTCSKARLSGMWKIMEV